jgi:hypothetical protein
MWHRVALVRTVISVERIAFIFRVTIIGEQGTNLEVTSNRSTMRKNTPHGVTSQKTEFFIVAALKPSNITNCEIDLEFTLKKVGSVLFRFGSLKTLYVNYILKSAFAKATGCKLKSRGVEVRNQAVARIFSSHIYLLILRPPYLLSNCYGVRGLSFGC